LFTTDKLEKASINPNAAGAWELLTSQQKKLLEREFEAAIKHLRNANPRPAKQEDKNSAPQEETNSSGKFAKFKKR
jgi:hypothetical protein